MPEQAIALKRCASCDRWRGEREPGANAESVLIADDKATGLCAGGPWDGQTRRVRSACGHWIVWHRLAGTTGG
jgi:hypothetical protein